jgi:protein-S-isoprenylcysteine O-methyltransferase Ste14
MSDSPYLQLCAHVAAFAFWSSFWPREQIKGRIEPHVGFRAYRIFYNVGTIFLFVASFSQLVHASGATQRLWQLQGHVWFRPLIYGIEGLGVFFLSACTQLGLSFWGLRNPPVGGKLQTGGFYKITRHPLYWSVFFFLFGHMLVLGSSLAVLYFVLMELYNIAGVIAFENRSLAKQYGASFAAFHERVSTLPFLSLLRGKVTLSRGELPIGFVLGSVAFTAAVIMVHDPVIVRIIDALPSLASLPRAGPSF